MWSDRAVETASANAPKQGKRAEHAEATANPMKSASAPTTSSSPLSGRGRGNVLHSAPSFFIHGGRSEDDMGDVKGAYPPSPGGNFRIKDTIGVPHPYCIGPKHVGVAADHHGGMLTKESIIDAERRGAKCGICKGKLQYAEHETALLVGCKVEIKSAEPELRDWLKGIVDEATKNGYAGFAFMKE